MQIEAIHVKLVDRSGTITTGGSSQQVMAANPNRHYLFIQNISDTDMWINFGAAATAAAGSILLKSGGAYYESVLTISRETINAIGATTGKGFTAKEG